MDDSLLVSMTKPDRPAHAESTALIGKKSCDIVAILNDSDFDVWLMLAQS
jgi:hypothetical protein